METALQPTNHYKLLFIFLLSSLLLAMVATAQSAAPMVQTMTSRARPRPRTGPMDFIKANCGATRYPALCVQSLSVYAKDIQKSPRQLAHAALAVSLAHARSATAFVAKLSGAKGVRPRDHAALMDCVENMGDSVDRLGRSIREMGRVSRSGRGGFEWHMSNVETWVSAALTDESTCVDGFAGPAMSAYLRATVKRRIVNVAMVTSNALALVNRFAQRQGGIVYNP